MSQALLSRRIEARVNSPITYISRQGIAVQTRTIRWVDFLWRTSDFTEAFRVPSFDLHLHARILDAGFTLLRNQTLQSWTLGIGHSWLLEFQVGMSFGAVPQYVSLTNDRFLYEPHLGLTLVLFGTMFKVHLSAGRGLTISGTDASGKGFLRQKFFGPKLA